MPSKPEPLYSPSEELANTLTHGFGILLSVAGLAVLVTRAALYGDAWQIVAAAIFGASMVLLYSSSTLYHCLKSESIKFFVRKVDHAAIYVLIAGTYTPFTLVNLRGPWGWSLFGVIWGLALLGIVLKFWFTGRFRVISTLCYIGMGWLIIIALKPMLHAVPPAGLWLLLAGGLCYTAGTVFYLWKSLSFHHAYWHLFVLAGTVCHFFAVLCSSVGGSLA
jgi:hemolysin III